MKKALSLLTMLFLLSAMLAIPALADMNTPSPEPTMVPKPLGLDIFCQKFSRREELILLKDKLYRLGYYTETTPEEYLSTDFLDTFTMLAVKQACQKNNMLNEYRDEGINRTVWDAIMNDKFIDANATPVPTAVAYQHIAYSGDATEVRNKLSELGYPETSNTYDDALIEVVSLYCELNNYTYNQHTQGGLTPAFQKRLFEQESERYSENTPAPEVTATPSPSPVPSMGDRMRSHFFGSTSLLGIQVPTIVIWLASMGVIACCVVAVILLFGGRNGNSDDKPTKIDGRNPMKGNELEFTVEYKGSVKTYRDTIDHALKIGRNVGNFPINMQDTQISRKHCEIYYSNRNLMLRDYSSNGTRINGKLCSREEYMLNNGDIIQIGGHIITIRF